MSPKLNHFSIGGYMKPKSKGWGFKTEIDKAGLLFTNQYGGIFSDISTIYGGIFNTIYKPTNRGYLCCSTIKQTFDPQSFQQTYQK